MRARNKAAASDITISIVGNGTLMERLRGLVRDQDLEGMVELLGQRNDVARLMRDADLYVNSSHYEGMPVAVIEALMSGLPVVATDVEGNREIIETGKNGLLVPASDPEVLAEAMLKVLGDSGLHAELSRGALDASKSFSLEATARLHLAIYSRLAEANEIGGVSPRMA
jgi:glycosyltransferase involved in cell wall biosynthesis